MKLTSDEIEVLIDALSMRQQECSQLTKEMKKISHRAGFSFEWQAEKCKKLLIKIENSDTIEVV